MTSAGEAPKIGPCSLPRTGSRKTPGRPADERGDQHHALDADVDDARALAHDAAQRGERDRRRRP